MWRMAFVIMGFSWRNIQCTYIFYMMMNMNIKRKWKKNKNENENSTIKKCLCAKAHPTSIDNLFNVFIIVVSSITWQTCNVTVFYYSMCIEPFEMRNAKCEKGRLRERKNHKMKKLKAMKCVERIPNTHW